MQIFHFKSKEVQKIDTEYKKKYTK
jgi:hypothetical protein